MKQQLFYVLTRLVLADSRAIAEVPGTVLTTFEAADIADGMPAALREAGEEYGAQSKGVEGEAAPGPGHRLGPEGGRRTCRFFSPRAPSGPRTRWKGGAAEGSARVLGECRDEAYPFVEDDQWRGSALPNDFQMSRECMKTVSNMENNVLSMVRTLLPTC
ncbi:unnamed protein product [Prorocentrum cordatum]|uniref:Uncharacterized protein n=1 Tax=Prorocentrum cordatum TaxID=2364126 RepID=A0ABN9T6J0_9DINO|nr:unnamed protein product [Polarella glacialis]